jgi:hypothetical protein
VAGEVQLGADMAGMPGSSIFVVNEEIDIARADRAGDCEIALTTAPIVS